MKKTKAIRNLLSLMIGFIWSQAIFCQVTITAPVVTISTCTFPTSYATIPNIILSEATAPANGSFGIGNNVTIIVTAPLNFAFDPGIGSVAYTSGRDITSASINVTSTDFTITFSCNGLTKMDKLTISNLRIRATSGSISPLQRSGGTANINGDFIGNTYATIVADGLNGIKMVGPSPSDYVTITDALNDVRARGISANTILELKSNYTSTGETFPLNFSGLSCLNAGVSLTVRPEPGATGLSIQSPNTVATVNYNGGSYIIFDGRPGGNGNNSELLLANTSLSGTVVQFINGASNNVIRYCTLRGVNTANKGIIYFSSSTAATGNNNNTIEFNELADGATTPTNAIVSLGTVSKSNTNNIISNNLIHDYFSAAVDCSGILMLNNTDSWIITGNSFYETSVRNFTATGAAWSAVQLNNKLNGTNVLVSGNYIGGQSPNCGGNAMTFTGTGRLQAIEMNAGVGTPSSVQGNTIANIDFTTNNNGVLSLIQHLGGSLNVGTTSANILGSQSQNSSVVFRMSGGTASQPATISIITLGLTNVTAGTVNVSNNSIGGIQVLGTGFARLRLIDVKGSLFQFTVSGNTIGGTGAGNISNATNAAITGIYSTSFASGVFNITNNIFRNFQSLPNIATEGIVSGIIVTSNAGNITATDYNISNNTIYNFTSKCTKNLQLGCFGISVVFAKASNNTINSNTIYNLHGNTTSFAGKICGIYITTIAAAPCMVAKNFIHSLSATSGNDYTISGIIHGTGVATYANNIVRIGVDEAGNTVTGNHYFMGFVEIGGSPRILYNTIYISGTNNAGSNYSCAFNSVSNGTRVVLNNIFRNNRNNNSGNNYATMVTTLTGFTSNNNNLYANGINGKTGWLNGTVYNSLSDWQTASGKDALSIAADPIFTMADGAINNTNFLISNLSPCNGTATLIAPANTITDDFIGAIRSLINPDMGAVENTLRAGYWTGAISSDWNDVDNWEDKTLPTSSIDVIISTGQNNMAGDYLPVITSGITGFAKNISLTLPTSSLIVTGTGKLHLAGAITNAGILDLKDGTLELAGTATQNIAGSLFDNHRVKNLVISNNVQVSANSNDTLQITNQLSFGNVNNKTLFTGNNVTIHSNASTTGCIADITNGGVNSGNSISGNVTVERYVQVNSKAWFFLAAPTIGNTLKQAWQEDGVALSNPKPGYGTILVGSVPNAVAQGFDLSASTSSILTYNEAGDSWDPISSTSLPVNDNNGYLVFIRGDRSVTAYNQPATATILRSNGNVYQPNNPPPSIAVQAGKLQSVANPYASAIDFSKVNRTGGVADIYYMWDPLLYGSFGYGGWQTFTSNAPLPGYTVTPGGGRYANGNTNIQSGQSFLVSAPLSSGTVSFSENCKAIGSDMVFRVVDNSGSVQVKLFSFKNNQQVLLDGVLSTYNDAYSDEVNMDDARKIISTSETISILSGSQLLSVEKRAFKENDSINYRFGQLRVQSYQLQVNMKDMYQPSRIAVITDHFTGIETPLNVEGVTNITFTVTANPASASGNRFTISFRKAAALPIIFTYVNARQVSIESVSINWGVDHETDILSYEIETSNDGLHFSKSGSILPGLNNGGKAAFNFELKKLEKFYRVKAINRSGVHFTSEIIQVFIAIANNEVQVFPNPVVNNRLNIIFSAKEKESYTMILMNVTGQIIMDKRITVSEDDFIKTVLIPACNPGLFTLKLISEKGNSTTQKIMLQ